MHAYVSLLRNVKTHTNVLFFTKANSWQSIDTAVKILSLLQIDDQRLPARLAAAATICVGFPILRISGKSILY